MPPPSQTLPAAATAGDDPGVRLAVPFGDDWIIETRDGVLEARRGQLLARVYELISMPIDPAAWRDRATLSALPPDTAPLDVELGRVEGSRWPCGFTTFRVEAGSHHLHCFFEVLWWLGHVHIQSSEAPGPEIFQLVREIDVDWASDGRVACLADVLGMSGPLGS
jgi:hypothetical protein